MLKSKECVEMRHPSLVDFKRKKEARRISGIPFQLFDSLLVSLSNPQAPRFCRGRPFKFDRGLAVMMPKTGRLSGVFGRLLSFGAGAANDPHCFGCERWPCLLGLHGKGRSQFSNCFQSVDKLGNSLTSPSSDLRDNREKGGRLGGIRTIFLQMFLSTAHVSCHGCPRPRTCWQKVRTVLLSYFTCCHLLVARGVLHTLRHGSLYGTRDAPQRRV